jgi:hypothetical protein
MNCNQFFKDYILKILYKKKKYFVKQNFTKFERKNLPNRENVWDIF